MSFVLCFRVKYQTINVFDLARYSRHVRYKTANKESYFRTSTQSIIYNSECIIIFSDMVVYYKSNK
jgi:hypothetical protein